MTYQTAFPDFDAATMPNILAGWVDISFKQDTCPGFSATPDALAGTGISVWVDYADPTKREFPESARFSAYMTDVEGNQTWEIESDDWAAILAKVEQWLPAWKALVDVAEYFPGFPPHDMPSIPAGFEYSADHRDMCPNFTNKVSGWMLWVNPENPEYRMHAETPRYSLSPDFTVRDDCWEDSHIAFDTWAKVVEFLAKFPTLASYEGEEV